MFSYNHSYALKVKGIIWRKPSLQKSATVTEIGINALDKNERSVMGTTIQLNNHRYIIVEKVKMHDCVNYLYTHV